MFFINLNNFHHFETYDTTEQSNVQPQLISKDFSPTVLIAQSVSLVFDRTLFQSMIFINSFQVEISRRSTPGLFGGQ